MREDMSKIFTRRQHRRSRGWRKELGKGQSRRIASTPLEDLPHFEAMSADKGFRKRRLGHGPMRKYLQSQTGRLWSEVFSEICAQCDLRSAAQKQFRQSLAVAENVVLKDGKPYESSGRYQVWHRSVWVHPQTGILMAAAAPAKRCYSAESGARRWRFSGFEKHRIDREHRLVFLENLEEPAWYVVKLAALPDTVSDQYEWLVVDAVLRCSLDDWHREELRAEWGGDFYAVQKYRAGGKLIRRYTGKSKSKRVDAHDYRLSPGRTAQAKV